VIVAKWTARIFLRETSLLSGTSVDRGADLLSNPLRFPRFTKYWLRCQSKSDLTLGKNRRGHLSVRISPSKLIHRNSELRVLH
jgi:hypothetical protein